MKKVKKVKKIDVMGKCFATLLLLSLFCTPPAEAGREGVRMPPADVNARLFDRRGRNGLSALMAAVGEAPFATDAHIAAAGAVIHRQTERLSMDSLSGRKVFRKPSRPFTPDEKRLLQRIDELEDVNATDENGRNALMQMMIEKESISHIGAEAIGRFLEQGLDIEARDADGLTALYYAQRRPELLKLLVEAGADVNAVVWTGDSLAKLLGQNYLLYGDRQDDTSLDTFAMLVDLGADLDLPNVQGETLLISIAESFYSYSYNDSDPKRTRSLERRGIRLLDLLAERGADVNSADVQGRTALTRIIRNNCNSNHNILRKLLALGADLNRKNPQGQSPLMLLVEQTIARYAKIDKEKFEARRQEAAVVVDIFLQAGAEVNAIDNEGRSVLMYALKGGARPEVLEKLIKAGANVNAADNEGTNVLLLALKIGQKNAVELDGLLYLLNAGIDPK